MLCVCVSGPTIAPALLHPLHPFHHPHEGPRALVSVLNPHIFPTFTWQLHYTRIFYIMPPSRPSRRMLWSQWRSRHSHNTTECTRLRGNGTAPAWRLTVSCGISFSDFGSKIPRYEVMGGDMNLKISLSLSELSDGEEVCECYQSERATEDLVLSTYFIRPELPHFTRLRQPRFP